MQFLKDLFKVDPTAGPMEKFVTYFVPVFVGALLLFLFLSCWGVFNNGISQAAHLTGFGGKLLGTIFLGLAILWAWLNHSDRVPFRVNDVVSVVLLGVLILFSVLFYTNFFTGIY